MKPIIFSNHAKEQMAERGADENEVILTIQKGEPELAKHNRILYRKNFQFSRQWRGKWYRIKQVVPVVREEFDKIIVITVYVFYF